MEDDTAVRLTARASALLFSAAQVAPHLGTEAARSSAPLLYRAFLAAHTLHFAAVTRYAVLTGGRNLFPGGRGLQEVGGWPTMAGIFALFAALAAAGAVDPAAPGGRSGRPRAIAARVAIGVMFTGTYLGQTRRSRWYAVPAGLSALGAIAGGGWRDGHHDGEIPSRPRPAARVAGGLRHRAGAVHLAAPA